MQPSTRRNLTIASLYTGTLILGMIIGPKFQKEHAQKRSVSAPRFVAESGVEKVDRVLNIIEENYVDPVKVDSMQDLAINQILKKLDPHSAYLPPVAARRQFEDLDGNYNGIGVEYQFLNDTVSVISVHKGGPAEKSGMKAGDQILKVSGESITGPQTNPQKIISLIKGRSGTAVDLLLKRTNDLKKVSVKREKIVVSSIDAAYFLEDHTGYIKISKFGARTDDDFAFEVNRMRKKGLSNLILDLRANGGGYLNAATALADQFLPDKKLIVYTKGEHEPRTDYFATQKGVFEKGKLVVLIDEHSASASEVFAGAIQDLDRGLIIGRRSFGKGLVQEQFNFGDGSALNLTVARYYTPSGRSIQRAYNNGSDKYYQDVENRFHNGEVAGKKADSLQKHKKYKTASGRVIYDGGGITPDIFVPVDTSSYNNYYYALNARGILLEFVYKNIVRQISPMSLNHFIDNFQISEDQYKKLRDIAASKAIKFSQKDAMKARPAIQAQVKALTARYYFGNEGFFRVRNGGDKVIARALESLKKS